MKKAENYRYRIDGHQIHFEVLRATPDSRKARWIHAQHSSEYTPQLLFNPIIHLNDQYSDSGEPDFDSNFDDSVSELEAIGISSALTGQIIQALITGTSLILEFDIAFTEDDGNWKNVAIINPSIRM
jgi:hypothetical protein